jgi:cytochrome c biogenesis protein CcmG, thiol:disulfide interchange protein DsbE
MTDLPELNLFDDPASQPERKGFSAGSIVLMVGIVVAAAVIGLALVRQKQAQPQSGAAPDFTVTTYDGETMALQDLRGKIVVVNFWASWCIPCKEEAPFLQSVSERYRDQDVVILGIAYSDIDAQSLEFIERYAITYPNAPDNGTRVSDAYHITGVPETFVIDRQGNIAYFFYAQVPEETLIAVLDRLIGSA